MNPPLRAIFSMIAGRRRINPQAMLCYKALGRAKMPILSAISFAALFFTVIYLNTIVSMSLSPYAFKTKETPELLQIHSTTARMPLRVMREEIEEEDDDDDQNPPVPPLNLSEQERISWFREKLPEFKIFKSTNLTRKFHGRVLEFFDQNCEARFFMTWISSARSFGGREFLAMESLFRTHPRGCLMIISTSLDSRTGSTVLSPLLDRRFRVVAVTPDLPFLFSNTPAEAWFNEINRGNRDPGEIPLAQNLSNLIRLALLFKYGGVYLDTDFILLKSLAGLRNSIGAQSIDTVSMKWNRLNNAVLVFDSDHPLLLKFMEEFATTFDGNKWGHNGPYLVSRVAAKVQERPGYNFTVLPPMALYPVTWTKIDGFFTKPRDRAGSRWMEAKLLQMRGETYGVHLWNKATRELPIQEGSIMARLISKHCVVCEDTYTS